MQKKYSMRSLLNVLVLPILLLCFLPVRIFAQNMNAPQFYFRSGNSLNAENLSQYYPPGSVTIKIYFRPNREQPEYSVDLSMPRTGPQKFIDSVLNIVQSWQFNHPQWFDGAAELSIDMIDRSILFDFEDLGRAYNSNHTTGNTIIFPDPENQKNKYWKVAGFRNENIILAPEFIKQRREAISSVHKLWNRLSGIFFITFLLLLIGTEYLIARYLASGKLIIGTLIVSAAFYIPWPLLGGFPDLSSSLFYWGIWCSFLAFIVYFVITKKSVLNQSQMKGDEDNIKEVKNNWIEIIRNAKENIILKYSEDAERRDKWNNSGLAGQLEDLLKKIQGSEEKRKLQSPFTQILKAGIMNHLNNGVEWYASQEIDRSVDRTIDSEIDKIEGKGLDILWSLASIAPMIGLLGTVVGIARAFGKISKSVGGTDPAEIIHKLSGNINIALYTTIVGLIIGMTALAFYYFIKNRLDGYRNKWASDIVDITNAL